MGGATRTGTGLVNREMRPTFPDRRDWSTPTVLRSRAAARPDAPFLSFPVEGRTWTYAEGLRDASSVARSLLGAGGSAGDRVLIMAANSSALVLTWLGSALAGMVEVPVNTAYEHDFLTHQVVTAGPRWVVVDAELAERFTAAPAAMAGVERFWVVGDGPDRDAAVAALGAAGATAGPWEELLGPAPAVALPEVDPSSPAAVFFTSGTTGPSKGVAMPHAQMYFFADEVVSLTRLGPRDVYLTTTPLFHGNAQFMAVYPAMVAGASAVVLPRFSASRWIDQVREHGVTVTNFLGVMMDFVWKQPRRPDDADNDLRCVFAAPTATSVVDGFRDRFGIEAFVEVFGLTETCAPITTPYGEPRPPGAVGLVLDEWFEVRLVDPDTDEEVPVGEVGELVVRPKHPWLVNQGYVSMPERTVEAWRNLWFHTGDALRRDAEGWYYFVDRYKDALRRRGENISSYEVEQALLGHPGVAACAVVGVPADVEAGEDEVLACVVGAGTLDPDDLWAWCDRRLPPFAVPRFLRVLDELPTTPSEKVRKSELRAAGVATGTFDRQHRERSTR